MPEKYLNQKLEEYHTRILQKKSLAESEWLKKVNEVSESPEKSGEYIQKLYNEGIYSFYEIPFGLKQLVEADAKVSLNSNLVQHRNRSSPSRTYERCQGDLEVDGKVSRSQLYS